MEEEIAARPVVEERARREAAEEAKRIAEEAKRAERALKRATWTPPEMAGGATPPA